MSLINQILNSISMPAPRPLPVVPPPEFAEARVAYQSEGRSGYVVFAHGGTRFSLYYELAGGDALAVIDVPTPETWKKHTGLPADTREPLLRFIGATVAHDQTADHQGRYVLTNTAIKIYA